MLGEGSAVFEGQEGGADHGWFSISKMFKKRAPAPVPVPEPVVIVMPFHNNRVFNSDWKLEASIIKTQDDTRHCRTLL